jgi:PAS domain S-box-containing protein
MSKILVVEDEMIVAWDIKETLEKLGHTVVDLVVSGTEAIDAAAIDRPDLVLMDIRLDGEIDGIAAGNQIYHQLKIPVIYLTAHADEFTLERAIKTSPFGYIVKPFQSHSLQSTIRVALQRHHLEVSAYITQKCLENTLNINSIGSGVISTDRQGFVTFMNPVAEELTGWQSAEAIGIEIDRIFCLIWESDGTQIENPSSRAMRLNQPIESPERCWLVDKSGLEMPISDIATPIVKPNGEIVGSIVVFQDNTKQLSTQMDLWERNQDLEFFQLKLISQLQAKTAEYRQAIACLWIWELVSTEVFTAHSERELLQFALQQISMALDIDYCWIARHDSRTNTATIDCEYINRERPIYPTSKIDREIDIQLYPRFYQHLFTGASWTILPPIAPKVYLDLLMPSTQVSIFPISIDHSDPADRAAQQLDAPEDRLYLEIVGEVGISSTGKPPWTIDQASPIAQILGSAIKLFRHKHSSSIDKSLEWLDCLQDDVASISGINLDLQTTDPLLQQQFSIGKDPSPDLATFDPLKLSINSEIFEAQWQRQVRLIDTLIDVQANGEAFQLQSLSDLLFYKWIATVVKSCGDLAQRYRLDFSDRITDRLPPLLVCPFPLLELTILELFHSACKYTPPDYPIVLEVDICEQALQLSVISLEIGLSTLELEQIFRRFTSSSSVSDTATGGDLSMPQIASTGLGLALIQKLVLHLGGKIQAHSDRDSTRLILSMPLLAPNDRS